MLNKQLKGLARRIRNESLRQKTVELLTDPTFVANGKTYKGLPLKDAPAGKWHHHSYPGGYVEHVVSATNVALAMCDSVDETYHGKVNRDFVLAGMLLHDVFKPATYSIYKSGSYGSTSLADFMDHLSIVTAELVRRDFPIEIVHIVAAHHGEF